MKYKANLEFERILDRVKKAYTGFPVYETGCFRELLQWLNRFDFTQDDEMEFSKFLSKTLRERSYAGLNGTPILQTQTHKLFLDFDFGLTAMNAARGNKPGIAKEKNQTFIHEFNPALQAERDYDTEE